MGRKLVEKGTAVTGLTGRPVAALNVNGSTVPCFLDTGSEVTIVKPQALKRIDPHDHLRRRRTTSSLRGVSGRPIDTLSEVTLVFHINSDLEIRHTVTVCDVRFPGDILLGIDFLRRTTFSLSSDSQDDCACLTLEGQEFLVNYTDTQSLQLSLVSVTAPETIENAEVSHSSPRLPPPDTPTAVHLYRTTKLPPHSGRFLEGVVARSAPNDGDMLFTPRVSAVCISPCVLFAVSGRRCPVWAVNNTARPVRLT